MTLLEFIKAVAIIAGACFAGFPFMAMLAGDTFWDEMKDAPLWQRIYFVYYPVAVAILVLLGLVGLLIYGVVLEMRSP